LILLVLTLLLCIFTFQMGQSLQWQLNAYFLSGIFGLLFWMSINLALHVIFLALKFQNRLTKVRDFFIHSPKFSFRIFFSICALLFSYVICFLFKSILVHVPPFLTIAYIIYLMDGKYSQFHRAEARGLIHRLFTPIWLSFSVQFAVLMIILCLFPVSIVPKLISFVLLSLDLPTSPPDFSFLALLLSGAFLNYLLPFYLYLQFNPHLLLSPKSKDFSYRNLYVKFKANLQNSRENLSFSNKNNKLSTKEEVSCRETRESRKEASKSEEIARNNWNSFFWTGMGLHIVWVVIGFWVKSYLFIFFSLFGVEYFIEARKEKRGVYQFVSFGVLNAIFLLGRMEDENAQKVGRG
jgi:hypothetical protein